jgi:tRNA threonylcarbamoyl adenosine modification protein (Sua5/YciO/YrdC/YwlC family)
MEIIHNLETTLIRLKENPDAVFMHCTGRMFGIGCLANSQKAADTIAKLKDRPPGKGFIVLIPHFSWLKRYGISFSKKEIMLMEQYWPGNMTFILESQDDVLSKYGINGTIAFRVPVSKYLREIMLDTDQPVLSTSINKGGDPFETKLDEIESKFSAWFDFASLSKNEKKMENPTPSTIIYYNSHDDKIDLIREGEIKFSEVTNSAKKPKITFTCTGNICRSPMAEFWFQKLASENSLNLKSASAGILESGIPISNNSKLVLLENGIDAKKHKSTMIDRDVISSSWKIITMTQNHKDDIVRRFPGSEEKVFTLGEISKIKGDIADPYGKDLIAYRHCFNEIKMRLEKLVDFLKIT